MSQCHDDYAEMRVQPAPAIAVRVTQCHDLPAVNVLVVESDRSTLRLIRRALASDQRLGTVSFVATGDEAVRRSSEVDVVLVDLRYVRGLGSLGTISRIARRPGHPRILALARSGAEWLSLAARCEGAEDVVDWPPDGEDGGDGGQAEGLDERLAERLAKAAQPAYSGTPY